MADPIESAKSAEPLKRSNGGYTCPECGLRRNRKGQKFSRYMLLLMHRVYAHHHKLNPEEQKLWGMMHHRNGANARSRGTRKPSTEAAPAKSYPFMKPGGSWVSGPFECPKCHETFERWIRFAGHCRSTKHYEIPVKATAIHKRAQDKDGYVRRGGYMGRGIQSAPPIAQKPERPEWKQPHGPIMAYVSTQPYQNGTLIMLHDKNGEAPVVFFGYPVQMKIQAPKLP